jgi:transformation/transcription domain-associated protein
VPSSPLAAPSAATAAAAAAAALPPPSYSEALRIELLKLATLVIEHRSAALLEHRKELIKFAWNHLKSSDSTSKQWAYANVCRFIEAFETPPKIILQVGTCAPACLLLASARCLLPPALAVTRRRD